MVILGYCPHTGQALVFCFPGDGCIDVDSVQRRVDFIKQGVELRPRDSRQWRIAKKQGVLSEGYGTATEHRCCNESVFRVFQMHHPLSSPGADAAAATVSWAAAPAAARAGVTAATTTRLGANLIPAFAKADWISA